MRSMQWQLGILGTISAFAYRHRETKKNLCRDGQTTRRHIPRDSAFHSHHRDTLTSDPWEVVSMYDLLVTFTCLRQGQRTFCLCAP